MNRFAKPKPPSFLKVFERTDEKDNRRLLDASMASFTDSVLPASSSSSRGVLGERQVIREVEEDEGEEDDEEDSVAVALAHRNRKESERRRCLQDEIDAEDGRLPSTELPEYLKPPNLPNKSQAGETPIRDGESPGVGPASPTRRESSSNQGTLQPPPVGFYRSASERRLPQMGGLARAPNSERSLGSSTSSMHYSPTKSPYAGSPQRLTVVPESLAKHAEASLFSPDKSSRKLSIFGRLRSKKEDEDNLNKPEMEVAVAEVEGGEGAMPFAQLTLEAVAPKNCKAPSVAETGTLGRGVEAASQKNELDEQKRNEFDETDSEHSFATEKLSNREGKGHQNRRAHSRSDSAHGVKHTSHRRPDDEGRKIVRNGDKNEHRPKNAESASRATSRNATDHDRQSKLDDDANDKSGRNIDGHHYRRRKSEEPDVGMSRNGDGHAGSKASHSSGSPDRRRKTSDEATKEEKSGKVDVSSVLAEPAMKRKSTRSPSQPGKASSPARSERKLQHVAETLEWRRVTRSPSKPLTRRDSHVPRRAQGNARVVNKTERRDRKELVLSASSDADSSRHSAGKDERKEGEAQKQSPRSAASDIESSECAQDTHLNQRNERSASVSQGSSSHYAKSLSNFLDHARSHSDHSSPDRLPVGGRSIHDEASIKSDGTAQGMKSNEHEGSFSQNSEKRKSTKAMGARPLFNGSKSTNQHEDTSRQRRKGLFQFPVDSQHTLDADAFQGECCDADRCSPVNVVGASDDSNEAQDGQLHEADPGLEHQVDALREKPSDSHQSRKGTSESHLSQRTSKDKNSTESCGQKELRSPTAKGGIFESSILKHCGEEVDVTGGIPSSPKLPLTAEVHATASATQGHGHSKHLTRRNRRRSSTTTFTQMSSSDVPMTPVRRHPRRASSNTAPASTGRIGRRVATLARIEKKHVSNQLALALGRNDDQGNTAALQLIDRAIHEHDGESEASIDLPVPVPIRFDEIPFLSISDIVMEDVEPLVIITHHELQNLSPQTNSITDLSHNHSGATESEHLAAGEPTIESALVSKARIPEEWMTENNVTTGDLLKDDECSRLSLDLAQSRIRLREARLEVSRLEQEVLRLTQRLLALEHKEN